MGGNHGICWHRLDCSHYHRWCRGVLAEQVMKSNMGVFMNILLGIVGAVIANAILAVFGIVLTGWLGYLIAGFIGACILIAIGRAFRRG